MLKKQKIEGFLFKDAIVKTKKGTSRNAVLTPILGQITFLFLSNATDLQRNRRTEFVDLKCPSIDVYYYSSHNFEHNKNIYVVVQMCKRFFQQLH